MHTYCNHSCSALNCFILKVPLSFPRCGLRVEKKILQNEGQRSNALTILEAVFLYQDRRPHIGLSDAEVWQWTKAYKENSL